MISSCVEPKELHTHMQAFFQPRLVVWGGGSGKGVLLVMDVKPTIFSDNKPLAPCSHHVMACDDLVSPKHDQAISRAVSAHLGSNGSSLSICHVLKPERFAASCIFSLMNSLFSIFFSSPFKRNPFPKKKKKKNARMFSPFLKNGCFLNMKLWHKSCNSFAVPNATLRRWK